jgi:hypothetical protein
MYPVRLRQKVYGVPGTQFHVEFELPTGLPFAPYPGLRLGLIPESDLGFDEYAVVGVLWHHPRREFLVELKSYPWENPHDAAGRLVDAGWRVYIPIAADTEDEAVGWLDGDSRAVVGVGGKWYAADEAEVWALARGGVEHVVRWPNGRGGSDERPE